MEMHQVRYFLAVSRHLNFTRAAEECNVAQPSLTRAIKKLEEELGGDLFRRERRTTHLTELGRTMLPLLRQCYESANTAKMLADSYASSDFAPLSLAVSKTVNLTPFVGPLTELARAMPGLSIRFFRGGAEEVAQTLKTGATELAIAGPFPETWERLNSWQLFTDPFTLTVHREHRLASVKQANLDALSGERLLARPYCEHHEAIMERLSNGGIKQPILHRMDSEDDVFAMLQRNAGVAILPRTARRPDCTVTIEIAELELERTVCLYEVAGRQRSPAEWALVKLLRSADLLMETNSGMH